MWRNSAIVFLISLYATTIFATRQSDHVEDILADIFGEEGTYSGQPPPSAEEAEAIFTSLSAERSDLKVIPSVDECGAEAAEAISRPEPPMQSDDAYNEHLKSVGFRTPKNILMVSKRLIFVASL